MCHYQTLTGTTISTTAEAILAATSALSIKTVLLNPSSLTTSLHVQINLQYLLTRMIRLHKTCRWHYQYHHKPVKHYQ